MTYSTQYQRRQGREGAALRAVHCELLNGGDAVTGPCATNGRGSDDHARGCPGEYGTRRAGAHPGPLRQPTPAPPCRGTGRDTIASLRAGRVGVSSMTEETVHVIQGMLARHLDGVPG
jgi:hypothetical protein